MFSGLQSSSYIEQLLEKSRFLTEENTASKGQGVVSIGFCLGGALSGLLACRDEHLKGAAIFYGNAPSEQELKNINCPVYGFYGAQEHAFFNDTRASYKVEASRDAFQRVLAFFHHASSK